MPPHIDFPRSAAVGFDVAAALWATPAALKARQRQRLQTLLSSAATHCRVYAGQLRGVDPEKAQLTEIEPMTKTHLMRHFSDWVTDPRLTLAALRRFTADPARIGEPFLGDYMVWTSSGSSGEPALFVQDARALAVYDALEALRRAPLRQPWPWFAPGWAGERFAFVGATDGHFASNVTLERLRRIVPGFATALRGFSFLLPPTELAAQLERFGPTVLATYPTCALMLAEEARAGRLRIAPREIWTGGETLTPAMRRRIEASFGCRVGNSYGASEFLALAAECRHGRLHVNEDWAILESVDRHLTSVPDGQFGHTTLLTNLANHVQPLIRYDLGDRIALHGDPCPCGMPTAWLEVDGRSDDLLTLYDTRRRAVWLSPLALTTVLEDGAGIFTFRLEQTGDAALLLNVAEGGTADRAAQARIRAVFKRYLQEQGLGNVTVKIVCGVPPAPGPGGKMRRVIGFKHNASGAT
ncbi:MAG: AMP-binding protein [Comamonas sp.]